MPYQRSLTIVAPVREGAEADVESLLATMGDGVANGSVIDFGALDGVHFARLMHGSRGHRPSGARLPASVILLSDFDVTVDAHLEQLVETAGRRASTGSSGPARATRAARPAARDRLDYLRRHVVKEAASYVNTRGRTVRQIRQESALRDAIEARSTTERDWDAAAIRTMSARHARARRAGSGARLGARAGGAARRSRPHAGQGASRRRPAR